MLFIFLVIAFAGMDWVTRIQKSLLVLLILAQFDMLIGSFVNTDYGKFLQCHLSPNIEIKSI